MGPISKRFKPAYSKVLMKIADGDLVSAELLLKAKGGRPENVVYLAQQAVEKALKALICSRSLPVPLTHDIEAILAVLPSDIQKPLHMDALVSLTEFATVRRYEEGFYEFSAEELQNVIDVCRETLIWAKSQAK